MPSMQWPLRSPLRQEPRFYGLYHLTGRRTRSGFQWKWSMPISADGTQLKATTSRQGRR